MLYTAVQHLAELKKEINEKGYPVHLITLPTLVQSIVMHITALVLLVLTTLTKEW